MRESNPGFNEYLTSQRSQLPVRGLDLEDFLIKPVQRLTKYPLFFHELLKRVPDEHPSRPALEKANGLMAKVSHSVDNSLAGTPTMQQLLENVLGDEYIKLLLPHRRVHHRFGCVCASKAETFQADCYLLTDLLLVCQATSAGLKPWLLASLRELLTGDEVRAARCSTVTSVTPVTSATPRHTRHIPVTPVTSVTSVTPPHPSCPFQALDGDRGQVATRVVGRSTTEWTLALRLQLEAFRLEFPSSAALDELERQLALAKEELDAIDADGRRAERRLRLELDEPARNLIGSLGTMRRKMYRRRSSADAAANVSGAVSLAPMPGTPYLFSPRRSISLVRARASSISLGGGSSATLGGSGSSFTGSLPGSGGAPPSLGSSRNRATSGSSGTGTPLGTPRSASRSTSNLFK